MMEHMANGAGMDQVLGLMLALKEDNQVSLLGFSDTHQEHLDASRAVPRVSLKYHLGHHLTDAYLKLLEKSPDKLRIQQ